MSCCFRFQASRAFAEPIENGQYPIEITPNSGGLGCLPGPLPGNFYVGHLPFREGEDLIMPVPCGC